MNRPVIALISCLFAMVSRGQQERLPADMRQHNLTTYNASLFNPAFSLDRNNPESVALWVRWQWQGIDSDPSTLFLNYTRKLNERSAAGAAFFQHNTGIFFNTGAALNYAYKFELNPRVGLSVGANLFAFKQKLADDRFQVDPSLPLPTATETNDFILQMAPGISLEVERLTLSLASENLLDYNFRAKEGNTAKDDKIFMSLLSYDFPVKLGSATNSFLRPSMYLRTIPGQSNQVGFYTLLNTDGYWGQVGYNNFYGFALGAGYTFFDRVSVGALAEFGTGASIVKESSFELMASYFLGSPGERHKMVGYDLEEDVQNPLDKIEDSQEEMESAEEALENGKKEKEAAEAIEKQRKEAEKEAARWSREQEARTKELAKESERLEAEKLQKEAKAAAEEQKADELAEERENLEKIQKEEADRAQSEREALEKKAAQPKVGEKYEEVSTEAGLLPGYYLIANVFGTQKYYDAFMVDLKNKGMQPKSFLRSANGFHYVYLQRYKTLQQARAARDDKYGGNYSGQTWIFRVVGE